MAVLERVDELLKVDGSAGRDTVGHLYQAVNADHIRAVNEAEDALDELLRMTAAGSYDEGGLGTVIDQLKSAAGRLETFRMPFAQALEELTQVLRTQPVNVTKVRHLLRDVLTTRARIKDHFPPERGRLLSTAFLYSASVLTQQDFAEIGEDVVAVLTMAGHSGVIIELAIDCMKKLDEGNKFVEFLQLFLSSDRAINVLSHIEDHDQLVEMRSCLSQSLNNPRITAGHVALMNGLYTLARKLLGRNQVQFVEFLKDIDFQSQPNHSLPQTLVANFLGADESDVRPVPLLRALCEAKVAPFFHDPDYHDIAKGCEGRVLQAFDNFAQAGGNLVRSVNGAYLLVRTDAFSQSF
jgi:hypothetical protein